MKSTAFFHVGFHKTGTTYIQDLLRQNAENLPNRYHFFVQGDAECNALRRSFRHRGVGAFAESRNLEEVEKTLLELDEIAGERAIVLSDETIFGYLPGKYAPFNIYHDLGERIEFIRKVLSNRDPVFFIYTRELTDWLLSVYKEAVKGHREKMEFESYVKRMKIGDGLVPLCQKLVAEHGETTITFRDMDVDNDEKLGVGTALLRWIGITDEELNAIHSVNRQNESLPDGILKAILAINRTSLPKRAVTTMVNNMSLVVTKQSKKKSK
ncbi:hypothetical protein Q0601_14990 [Paracoccus onubensis]|uniref:hypothetical protein n=1 Tax=Paracoccus onubensis TaxID=1675788 RepID=UPI0027301A39|nr:hypothetical protein [Paracoccus onubensis]MDP0928490.1 hypothetical protein [Paracoccus onubensis]